MKLPKNFFMRSRDGNSVPASRRRTRQLGLERLERRAVLSSSGLIGAGFVGLHGFGFVTTANPTLTKLKVTPNETLYGGSFKAIANVTALAPVAPPGGGIVAAPKPTGFVNFYENGTEIGSARLNSHGSAVLRVKDLPASSELYGITAIYAGSKHDLSSSSATEYEKVNPITTATTLSVSKSSILAGQSIELTADVTDATATATRPTGLVQFFDNGIPIGVASVAGNGVAKLNVQLTLAGSHAIQAVFNGEPDFTTSESSPVSVIVAPGDATRVEIAMPDSTKVGAAVPLTLTALDHFGNIATSFTGEVSFASTDPLAVLPADTTFTASDDGIAQVTGLVFNTIGKQTLTVTEVGSAAVFGKRSIDVKAA